MLALSRACEKQAQESWICCKNNFRNGISNSSMRVNVLHDEGRIPVKVLSLNK